MTRPPVWKRWNENPILSIMENQEVFEKYFLKPMSCIKDTPKQWHLFKLWLSNDFLDKGEELVSYTRLSKRKNRKHTSHKYAKTGLVNLKFIEYLAAIENVHFDSYEREILKIIIFDKRERLLSRKGGRFLDKVRDFLLEICLMRLNKIKEELRDWTTTNENLINNYLSFFDERSLDIQNEGIKELLKIKQEIEEGKNVIIPNVPSNKNNVAYHLIHIIPLSLVIKIFRIYLPFFIGDEFIREKYYEFKFKLKNLVNIKNSIATFKGVKITEKDKIKLKRINILKSIVNEYLKYKDGYVKQQVSS